MNKQYWQPIAQEKLADFQGAPRDWLTEKMTEKMPWLLVHADDGVIWGRREQNQTIVLSSDLDDMKSQYPVIAVELRAQTVQQARIFGPEGELLLWREGMTFRGRSIMDGEAVPDSAWHEQQILWGRRADKSRALLCFRRANRGCCMLSHSTCQHVAAPL
ncbi:MAG: hypothetical protein IPO15_10450 [Anaerolineae bacterium]|uniref:type III-D CRISPR-associated protein Csx19 n=1 Tax=Candidatus Amarolinea dominans TaxID=3140696 RepID=UPI003134A8CF|nr:hypothetical protein [Anaerolineae bacterium]